MEETWALKYRPNTLRKVLGQEIPIKMVRGALRLQNKPRTWLLRGPWGAGKTSIARILAKCLICPFKESDNDCCGKCSHCLGIDSGNSLNYTEIDSASSGSVDSIRELIVEAELAPIEADWRVLVLDEAHMLTVPAQNALLKSLEDGVGQTIFVLVTTDPQKLKPTILSRCTHLNLEPISKDLVVKHLESIAKFENVNYDLDALKIIVDYTAGHMRDALNTAQQMSLTGGIYLNTVKRHLNLHLEEEAIQILLLLQSNWTKTIELVETSLQDNSPESLWRAVCKVVVKCVLYHLAPRTTEVENGIQYLASFYSPKLLSAGEWILEKSRGYLIFGREDILVVLAILRDRLGTVVTPTVNNKPMGQARRFRPLSNNREVTLLEPEEVIETLKLKQVEESPENHGLDSSTAN